MVRCFEAVRKGYWKADSDTVKRLVREYADTVEDVGLTCCDHTCNNPKLKEFIKSVMVSVPALKQRVASFDRIFKATTTSANSSSAGNRKPPVEQKKSQQVEGYEMEGVKSPAGAGSAPVPYVFIIGFMLFLFLIFLGYRKGGRRR